MKNEIKITIPDYVRTVLDRLNASGYEAFCVGGCVRDSVLGLLPSDWDITTSAVPAEIIAAFSDFTVIETGKKHGTVTIISNSRQVEVTTFRIDGIYIDARHPEAVHFSKKLTDDLSRRDFTINAMAYNDESGVIDLFGGLEDVHKRMIRCVGSPESRFNEDALRILRCCRFSSQLGFDIEEKTHEAAISSKLQLERISKERVSAEISKLLCGDFAEKALRENAGIIFTCIPQLAPMKNCTQENPYHIYDVWEHSLHALSHTKKDLITRFAILLHDCGKPSVKSIDEDDTAHFYGHAEASATIANDLLFDLRFPTKIKSRIAKLVKLHDQPLPMKDRRIKKLLIELQIDDFNRLLDIMKADISAQAPNIIDERLKMLDDMQSRAEEMLREGLPLSMKDIAVNGDDLIALGYASSEKIGNELRKLFEIAVNDPSRNAKEHLLKIAQRNLHKKDSF